MRYVSVSHLAGLLGVHRSAVRRWARRGEITAPTSHPATGEQVYESSIADEIELWYLERAASGGTRGPGAAARRARAQEHLKDRDDV